MIKKIITFFRKPNTLLIFIISIILFLIVLNAILPVEIKERLNLVQKEFIPDFKLEQLGDGEVFSLNPNKAYKIKKDTSLDAILPYYSEQFNVVYSYGTNIFSVYINPSTDTTEQDVYEWFESFNNVKNHKELNIEFIQKSENSGAPAFKQ